MCGRYTLIELNKLQDRFKTINRINELHPNYNVAPGQIMPVIIDNHGNSEIRLMKWGLVPFWAKDPRIGFKMINARAEGVESKPSFRRAFKSQRCLVPANGFYEWQKEESGKIPKYIGLRGYSLLSFAGLWEKWKQPDDRILETYTIITTSSNEMLEPIHDRIPVILSPHQEDDWLNPQNTNPGFLTTLLKPYSSSDIEEHTVSTQVNSIKNNNPQLIEPI